MSTPRTEDRHPKPAESKTVVQSMDDRIARYRAASEQLEKEIRQNREQNAKSLFGRIASNIAS